VINITLEVFQGNSIGEIDIEERLSRAFSRTTKREGGAAYSLLIVSNINMPLIDSEGRQSVALPTTYTESFRSLDDT
jgi:hypothetical protein